MRLTSSSRPMCPFKSGYSEDERLAGLAGMNDVKAAVTVNHRAPGRPGGVAVGEEGVEGADF